MKFTIGTGDKGALTCDLKTLVDTRLLVQANSGGGKSWCLRRLLEQTHGHVQHLVIDPEGEFASLRERFDYVLAARNGGDTAADPRAAKLLAERLLELGVSAVLDIYELQAHDRVRFVRAFLEALVDAPKKLWHPALVVVDEAHVFCPEKGSGEAESAGAVIDLATRGRKRGFCAVLATQRIAKLHKDAAAECNNKLIGRTGLDVDIKRAASELGFGRDRWRDLRELGAGEFYAYGPALSRSVTALTVGEITTTHPKAGARLAFTAPPPTAKVRALLPKLADLPAEAEERQRTVADLRKDVQRLGRELAAAKRAQPAAAAPAERVEVSVLTEADRNQIAAVGTAVDKAVEMLTALNMATVVADLAKVLGALREPLVALARRVNVAPAPPVRPSHTPPTPVPAPRRDPAPYRNGSAALTATQQRVLDVVGMLEVRGLPPDTDCVARWQGIHPKGGRYGTDVAFLRKEGYLDGWRLTDAGRALVQPMATGLEPALAILKDETMRRDLRAIVEAPGLTTEGLAERIGIHPKGGRYGSNLAWLRTMKIITERAPIAPTEALFR